MDNLDKALRDELLDVAHELADVARKATLSYFRNPHLVTDNKECDGFDPVTAADRATETAMRDVLQRRRPQDSILGEEYAPITGESGLTWVLDPIDGTRAYISGTPTWGVLIGLRSNDQALLGIIDQPYIGERFVGGFGQKMVSGPHGVAELHTRPARDLSQAIIFTTFPEVGSDFERRAFHALAGKTQLTRYGMDCYAYGLLAAGHIDLVVEAGLKAYDIMAPIAVIEAAGGVVTDWAGGPVLDGGRALAAANAEIHAAALAILQDNPLETDR